MSFATDLTKEFHAKNLLCATSQSLNDAVAKARENKVESDARYLETTQGVSSPSRAKKRCDISSFCRCSFQYLIILYYRARALGRVQKQANTMRQRAERKMGQLEVGCVVQVCYSIEVSAKLECYST